ncbi:MAG: hypothetical protein Pg6C_16850 [Treponemataceae bacterium]|nr:MAG: hypothetical protein Pg6C_16850 [Treponemataceae bacterium]
MNVDIVVKKPAKAASKGLAVPHSAPFTQRYGAWGRVDKVYSNNHTADVYLDTGVFLKQVPVASKEWVMSGDDYTTGQRDLPLENARVFVFMPYGIYDGCFVLCSGFVVTDKAQKGAFMEDEKEKSRKRVYPGNWKEEYDCASGTHEIISPDGKTSLKIDYGTEQEAKDPPELHLKLFDNIKADVVSDESITLSAFDDEVKIEHTKGDNAKVTLFDSELTVKNGEVSIVSGGKIYIGGSADNVCALWLAMLDELIDFKTMGPPPQHVTHPQTVAKINAFKEKVKALYKESV